MPYFFNKITCCGSSWEYLQNDKWSWVICYKFASWTWVPIQPDDNLFTNRRYTALCAFMTLSNTGSPKGIFVPLEYTSALIVQGDE